MFWQTARHVIDLSLPRVMGIVNLTPDSFSDGGALGTTAAALAHCERLLAEGADVLDIGGESSRPGAPPVPLEEERQRVLPVLREAVQLGVPVSLDSCKPELMREALDLGVDILNDIWALRRPGALEAAAAHPRCGICLMHMHGEPLTMQRGPMQGEVVGQVLAFLRARTQAVQSAGIDLARIAWDPGIGFGKTTQHNLLLLARQRELLADGRPLVVGWSRKSSLGELTGHPVHDRLAPSLAAVLLAVQQGAHVVRVHDVADTVAALKIWVAAQSALLPIP